MDKQIKNAIENGKSFKKRKTEFFMKSFGEDRGITLIALIITVIVLLLLAGVTIATLTGDNGILSQAQNASEVSDIAEVEELLQLEYANLVIDKLAYDEEISLEQAISNYNTRYPQKAPITTETVGGELVINEVTLSTDNLRIGVDTTNSSNVGTITVAVDSTSNGGEKHFAQINGKKYEVTINNGIISVSKTPASTSGSGGLVIEATVSKTSSNETIAEATVGNTTQTANGSNTVVTITGNGTAGNTTINIIVNNTPYSVALVAKASLLSGGTADATETDNYTDTAGKTATVPKGYTVSNVEGEKLISQGLVIRKGLNEYVWIEVPRTGGPNYSAVAGTTVDSPEYYTAIEDALIDYSGFAKTGTDAKTTRRGWKDEWYDSSSHTYDGSKWYSYDGTEDTSYTSGDSTSTAGCGLSYTAYNTQYKKMLKSVYTNGGFWIGRYEASSGGTNVAPLSQPGKNVQTLTCSNAQIAAARIATSDTGTNVYTSSLMFGVQWDLVCKFLEGSTEWPSGNTPSNYIKADSSSWGNYKPTSGSGSVKSTGSSTDYKRRNIFDFAGNQWECTLEHATSYSFFRCALRGGNYNDSGSDSPASCRSSGIAGNHGFRVSLY